MKQRAAWIWEIVVSPGLLVVLVMRNLLIQWSTPFSIKDQTELRRKVIDSLEEEPGVAFRPIKRNTFLTLKQTL